MIQIRGEGSLFDEKINDFKLVQTQSKTKINGRGAFDIELGQVAGNELGSLGSDADLEVLSDANTQRMKLKGTFTAGPLVNQSIVLDYCAE